MSAAFIYPPNGNFSDANNEQPINVFDTLLVEYSSSWSSLNLKLFCQQNAASGTFYYHNVPQNPLPAFGTFDLGTIEQAQLDAVEYPTTCHLKITQGGNNDNGLSGEDFQVTSSAGTSTTYSPSATAASSSTSTPPVQPTTTSAQTTATTTQAAATSAQTTTALSQTTSPAATTSSPSGPAGLSAGAGAGIGVGAAAAVALLLAIGFILFRKRQKRKLVAVPQHDGEK